MQNGNMLMILMLCLSQFSMVTSKDYVIPTVGFGDEDGMTSELLLSNTGPNTISVYGAFHFNNSMLQEFTLSVNAYKVIAAPIPSVPLEFLLNGSEIANKSMVVNSAADSLQVHLIVGTSFHNEGSVLISTDDVGTEYYVSTFCALGGYCQIGIATVAADITFVYVKLPDEVDDVSICVGKKTWTSADRSFHLRYPETIQIKSTYDLTGTYIYSDTPVSVVTGTRSMPAEARLVHFYEQLTPVPHWGTKFVVQGFGSDFGSIVHITASSQYTYIDMTGFKTTKLSTGETLKRRIEENIVAYIEATNPVQVIMYTGITYGSSNTIVSVAMTTIPAVEHFMTSYIASCGTGETTFRFITQWDDAALSTDPGDVITRVHLTEYKVVETTQTNVYGAISSAEYFGGLMQCGTALFPLAPPLKPTLTPSCQISFARHNGGDGIDNNCAGGTDTDKCYENVKITSKFVVNGSGYLPAHTEDISSLYQILVRVQSCDIVQIELLSNLTSEVVIHISSSSISMYRCSSTCVYIGGIATSWMSANTDCSRVVRSYWITHAKGRLCVNSGNNNLYGHCDDQLLKMTLTNIIDQIRLSGLTGDAVIWYDLYSADCGQFISDWRCHDTIPNCHKYQSDLCTNPRYASWVDFYCKKFCGLCSPDHRGRMFVYTPPPDNLFTTGTTQKLVFLGSNGTYSKIGLETANFIIDTISWNTSTNSPQPFDSATADVDSHDGPVRIFSEDDIAVAYTIDNEVYGYVQPLDVLGTEYMTLSFLDGTTNEDILTCYFTALSAETSIQKYSDYSYEERTGSFEHNLTAGDQTGSVFKGNQPFSAWCGTSFQSTYGFSWYQLPPTNTWGTQYITPILHNDISASIMSKIRIVTNSAYTAFEIHGDFNGTYELTKRGDFEEFDISPTTVYNITSNFPVAVAVLYYSNMDPQDSSFHFLPPVTSFDDTPLILFGYNPSDLWVYITTTTYNTTTDVDISAGELQSNPSSDPTSYPTGIYAYQQNHSSDVVNASSFMFSYRQYAASVLITPSTHLFKDLSRGRICELVADGLDDGIDNDCDGVIDEEITCITGFATIKTDEDLDGNFGEDCHCRNQGQEKYYGAEPEYVWVFHSPEPARTPWTEPAPDNNCAHVVTNLYGCSEYCICKCSWQLALEAYNNMTDDQKDAYNDAAAEIYKKKLKVDTSKLSSTVAARESAPDERQSSQNIGLVGVLMIVLVVSFIVLFDVITIIQTIISKCSRTNVQAVSS